MGATSTKDSAVNGWLTPISDVPLGTTHEGYTLCSRLGSGPLGISYKAIHLQNCSAFVVKIVTFPESIPMEARKSMRECMERLSRIPHPNVVEPADMLESGATALIVSPFVEGTPLSKRAPLGWGDELQRFSRDILSALFLLHSNRIEHGGLHRGNVLIDEGGSVVISDVGYASMLATMTPRALHTLGFCDHLPPEVLAGGAGRFGSRDIWAVGVLLYFAATGELPFPVHTVSFEDVVREVATRELHQPANCGGDLWALVSLLLHRDPAKRPSAAKLMRNPFFSSLSDFVFADGASSTSLSNAGRAANSHRHFSRFFRERMLGRGPHGDAYLVHVRDVDNEKLVLKALKVSLREGADHRGIAISKKIRVPQIVNYVEVVDTGGSSFVTQEYLVDGDVLQHHSLETDQLFTLASDVLLGLAHLHANGLYHGNLKPSNILMRGSSFAIADFGPVVVAAANIHDGHRDQWPLPPHIIASIKMNLLHGVQLADIVDVGMVLCRWLPSCRMAIPDKGRMYNTADFAKLQVILSHIAGPLARLCETLIFNTPSAQDALLFPLINREYVPQVVKLLHSEKSRAVQDSFEYGEESRFTEGEHSDASSLKLSGDHCTKCHVKLTAFFLRVGDTSEPLCAKCSQDMEVVPHVVRATTTVGWGTATSPWQRSTIASAVPVEGMSRQALELLERASDLPAGHLSRLRRKLLSEEEANENVSAETLVAEAAQRGSKDLILASLRLTVVPSLDKVLDTLVCLDVSGNSLTELPPLDTPTLRTLRASSNALASLPSSIGSGLPSLTLLDVSHNRLSALPPTVMFMEELEEVGADYNEFAEWPEAVFELPNLRTLRLCENPLRGFEAMEQMGRLSLTVHLNNHPALVALWRDYKEYLPQLSVQWNKVYPDEVVKWLFCGALRSAQSEDVYQDLGITYVLTVGRDLHPCVVDGMTHRSIDVDDIVETNLGGQLAETTQFIDEAMKKETGCLVHCFAGQSRSATVVIAYLMMRRGMRMDDAYLTVKRARPAIFPNEGFYSQLQELDAALFPGQRPLKLGPLERELGPQPK